GQGELNLGDNRVVEQAPAPFVPQAARLRGAGAQSIYAMRLNALDMRDPAQYDQALQILAQAQSDPDFSDAAKANLTEHVRAARPTETPAESLPLTEAPLPEVAPVDVAAEDARRSDEVLSAALATLDRAP